MKILEHEKSGKPESMTLSYDPLVIWLNRRIELRIEKGDQLRSVVLVVLQYWPLKPKDAASAVAFFFAIGERQAAKKKLSGWKAAELIVNPKRRYLK